MCNTAKLWWHASHQSSAYKHIFFLTGTLLNRISWHTLGQLHPNSEDMLVCLLNPVLSTNSPPCHKSHWAEFCSLLTLYRQIDFWVSSVRSCRARSEPGGTRWRTGGEVKGKLSNGVGSQYSHATSERGLSSITQADAHTSAASSRLNWRPHRFKWTSLFRGKTKSGFCACAITFRMSYIIPSTFPANTNKLTFLQE